MTCFVRELVLISPFVATLSFTFAVCSERSRYSSGGIVTKLRTEWFGVRGPGFNPSFYPVGTESFFPRGKTAGA